jgi:Ca2+-binding EF-hand superfamily protein
MNKTTTLLATALLIGGAVANAQTPPRKPFGTGDLPAFLKPYDLDGDGKLSAEERQAFEQATREARPQRPGLKNPWDTDGDGKLSPEEIQAARDAIKAKMEDLRLKRFTELDKDADGLLTAEELKAIPRITDEMVTRMITHLDKDADGKISKDEFMVALRPPSPPPPPFPLHQPLPNPLPLGGIPVPLPLVSFDTNKDGRLGLAEIQAMLGAINTDANPFITPEEWAAYVKAHPEILPPPPID